MHDLARTQKVFAKLVLKNKYQDYETALLQLNLQTLTQRRKELSLNFAKQCIENEKLSNLFPKNEEHEMKTRNQEKYKVLHANTNRLRNSPVIQMQHLLNKNNNKMKHKLN